MKKILIITLSLFLNLQALDLSSSNSQNLDITNSKNLEHSKNTSQNTNNNKSKTLSKSKTKSNSVTNAKNLDKFSVIIQNLIYLEQSDVYPFSQCKLFTEPKRLKDFDLNCNVGASMLTTKCQYLDSLAKNQSEVEQASYNAEEKIKNYIKCGLLYSAIIVNSIKNNPKNILKIKDKSIIKFYNNLSQNLDYDTCYFNGTLTSVQCGSITANISSILKMNVSTAGLLNEKDYLGYTINKNIQSVVNTEKRKSYEKRNEYATQQQMSKTLKYDKSLASKQSKETAQKLNISSFIKE